ncbi:20S proteasome subunit [Chiua virens]|nr:20S proteasome subunit [Chiua virens]
MTFHRYRLRSFSEHLLARRPYFSAQSDGYAIQVEYANKAVENSGTAIGLRVKDGVVLAVEKLIHSKLLVPGANRRIQTVDRHIGMATAGLLADGRNVSNRARSECTTMRNWMREPPTLKACYLSDRMGQYAQVYTLYSSVRPFGISTIFAGVDKTGPSLYVIEPSGVCLGYHGAAIGKGRQLAKTELEKLKLSEAFYKGSQKEFELEMSWVGSDTNGLHVSVPADLLAEAEQKAKEALENFE